MHSEYYFISAVWVSQKNFEDFSAECFAEGCDGIEEIAVDGNDIRCKVYWTGTDADKIATILAEQKKRFPEVQLSETEKHKSIDWGISWRENFYPIEIGENFLVRPSWSESVKGKKNIVIYPGRSFGTGYHASTALALSMIERAMKKREYKSLLDVGSGSGILAIAGALFEIPEIRAFEIDDSFQEEIPKNFDLSGLAFQNIELLATPFQGFRGTADLITANITADVLMELQPVFVRCLKSEGTLVLSGIYELFREEFECEFAKDFKILQRETQEEWSAYLMVSA